MHVSAGMEDVCVHRVHMCMQEHTRVHAHICIKIHGRTWECAHACVPAVCMHCDYAYMCVCVCASAPIF